MLAALAGRRHRLARRRRGRTPSVREALADTSPSGAGSSEEVAWERAARRRAPLGRDRAAFHRRFERACRSTRRWRPRPARERARDAGSRRPGSRRCAISPACESPGRVATAQYPAVVGAGADRLLALGRGPEPAGALFAIADPAALARTAASCRRSESDDRVRRRRADEDLAEASAPARSSPTRGSAATMRCSRSAAASSATSPASAPRSTSAASPSCRSRRRSSPRSTPPTAARPGWTCRRRRTTSAPTTSRRGARRPATLRRCLPRRLRRASPRS